MSLALKNPSVNWEPVPIGSEGRHHAWAWFRPPGVPSGLIIGVPLLLFAEPVLAPRLTIRNLVQATGLDPSQVHCWVFGGMTFDGANGVSPYLDQPLAPPAANGPLNLIEIPVWMIPEPVPIWNGGPPPVSADYQNYSNGQPAAIRGPVSEQDIQLLAAIDSCWNGILQLEARISTVRKELGSSVSRLNSLNRDLTIDERRSCDSKDVQDWTDARRWLRDSLSTLARSVKEIDVGTISGAGQRHKFEDLYQNYIAPRIPWPGLSQAVNEFEHYRKTMQNVLAAAQGSISKAGRDAEQRANSVLQRVGSKMRANRRK